MLDDMTGFKKFSIVVIIGIMFYKRILPLSKMHAEQIEKGHDICNILSNVIAKKKKKQPNINTVHTHT